MIAIDGKLQVVTKSDAYSMIEAISDADFNVLRDFLNSTFGKSKKRIVAEKKFVAEVSAAEKSVDEGNFVKLSELHEFLGV